MADSAIRQEAMRLIAEGQSLSLMGTWQAKGQPAIAAAILDLADAVRELARSR
jgi:hypothetical protein